MEIRFIKHHEIDFQKWNACIQHSQNGLIYGRYEYLNAMCETWDALILGNYKAVMPLTYRSKFGIKYLYQPAFVQQTGIFGNIEEGTISAFLRQAKNRYRFAEVYVNYQNKVQNSTSKSNQIVFLHKNYRSLSNAYSNQTIRKIKQCRKTNADYKPIDPTINIKDFERYLRLKIPHIRKDGFDQLNTFCLQYPDLSLSRGLMINNKLTASVTAIRDDKRMFILTPLNHERNSYPGALHSLIDHLINEFSNQDLILDFEGSDIPGVYAFNKGFGAVDQPYSFVRWNHLPWPLSLIKG